MKKHGNSGLLHINKLGDFIAYLERIGYTQITTGDHKFEVARLRKTVIPPNEVDVPILIYRRQRADHLTVVNGFNHLSAWLMLRKQASAGDKPAEGPGPVAPNQE